MIQRSWSASSSGQSTVSASACTISTGLPATTVREHVGEPAVELDRAHVRAGVAQRERQRTETGPDLDHVVAGLHAREPHDVRGHVGVGEKVLTERLARSQPVLLEQRLDLARRHRSTPNTRAAFARVELGDLARRRRRARAASAAPTIETNAGSLGLPRCGTGARYGLSVSTNTRSAGASAAAARTSSADLERHDAAERQVAVAIERERAPRRDRR